MGERIWDRFEPIRTLPRTTLALFVGGVLLAIAGILSALIWYTGTLEPTPEQVAAAQPTALIARTPPPQASGTAAPTPIPPTSVPTRLIVANTGGLGAVIRAEPNTDGKVVAAVPEGTVLQIAGSDVQGEGRTWRAVKDDDGNAGYIAGELVKSASD